MKCNKEKLCKALDDRLTKGSTGLSSVNLIDLHTGKDLHLGVKYKYKSDKKGTMINFCPFCGENIQFWNNR